MAPAPGSTGGSGFTILILQVAAIGLVFYFLIIRPQSTARKQHEQLLSALKRGDEITTSGGLIGKVKDIKDDRVTVESGTATVVVERARIVRVGQSGAPSQAG
jgi:preprotein translocase subunit YajC